MTYEADRISGAVNSDMFRSSLNAYKTQLQRMKDSIYGRTEPDAPKSDKGPEDDTNPFSLPDDENRNITNPDNFDNNGLGGSDDHLYEESDQLAGRNIENPDNYMLDGSTGADPMDHIYQEIDNEFMQSRGSVVAEDTNEPFPSYNSEAPEGSIPHDDVATESTYQDNYSDASTQPLYEDPSSSPDLSNEEISFFNPTYQSETPSEGRGWFANNETTFASSGLYDNPVSETDDIGNNDTFGYKDEHVSHGDNTTTGDETAMEGAIDDLYATVQKGSPQVEPIPQYTAEEEKEDLYALARNFEVIEEEPPELPPRPQYLQHPEDSPAQSTSGTSNVDKKNTPSTPLNSKSTFESRSADDPYASQDGDSSDEKKEKKRRKKKKKRDEDDDLWD